MVVLTTVIVASITFYATVQAVTVTISKKSWDEAERLVSVQGGKLNSIKSDKEFDYLISDTFYIRAKKDPVNGYNQLYRVNTQPSMEQ